MLVKTCRNPRSLPDATNAAARAHLAMGRVQAAIALAVVSTKDPAHFRTTPGGYFYGTVAKAKAGELNLGRTL